MPFCSKTVQQLTPTMILHVVYRVFLATDNKQGIVAFMYVRSKRMQFLHVEQVNPLEHTAVCETAVPLR
jgi:hypothetical protein